MITVFIWDFVGKDVAWGHASMQCGDRYISWWPEPGGRVPKLQKAPQVYDVHPFVDRTYNDDVRDEERAPDWTIDVPRLDEQKIKEWWAAFNPQAHGAYGPPSRPWSTLTWNCSTVVAEAITAGGGADFVSWYTSRGVVWTPKTVREYALAVSRAPGPRPKIMSKL